MESDAARNQYRTYPQNNLVCEYTRYAGMIMRAFLKHCDRVKEITFSLRVMHTSSYSGPLLRHVY